MRLKKRTLTVLSTLTVVGVLLFLAVSSFAQQTAGSETISATVAKARIDEGKMPSVDKVTVSSSTKKNTEAAVGTSTDSPQASSDDGGWHLEIRPYFWAAGLNGSLRARNTTVPVTQDLSSILGQLGYAVGAQVEAGKGRWRVILDEDYLNLGTEVRGSNGNATFAVEPTLNIFEGGASYELVATPHSGDTSNSRPPAFSAELLGGVRWIRLRNRITPAGGAEVGGTTDHTGYFVGNRYKFNVSDPITLVGKWTVGTSGVRSNVNGTAEGYADVRVAHNFSLTGGYRFMNINADDAEDLSGFRGQLKGFFAGFVIGR